MTSSNKSLLSDDYRRELSQKHGNDESWGNTGIRYYPAVLSLIEKLGIKSILDYGCGKGMVGKKFREDQAQPGSKLADVAFYEYDPGIEGKTDTSTTGDLVINTDVLEHIEPEFLGNVLYDMNKRAKKAAFMVISCVPAFHRLSDGRNAHLIIEEPEWWDRQIGKYFNIAHKEFKGGEYYVVAMHRDNPQEPNNADILKELEDAQNTVKKARELVEKGQLTKAVVLLNAMPFKHRAPEAFLVLSRILVDRNDLIHAASNCFEFLKYRRDPEATRLMGILMSKLGQDTEALRFLESPECADCKDDEYFGALLLCWNRQFQPKKVIEQFPKIENPGPLSVDAYVQALILTYDHAGAVAAAEKATERDPQNEQYWAILQKAYDLNRRFEDALRAAQRAVELKPDGAGHHSNLGLVLMHNQKLEESAKAFDRAIELDPLLAASYINRAGVSRLQKKYAEEEAFLRLALELDPVSPAAKYGLGICLLRQENYTEGFRHAEWYWHRNLMTSTRLPLAFQRWYGEDLTGKTLLVYADQGVGDTIMMARYNRAIIDRYKPRKLVFNVNVKLRKLFEHNYADLIASGRAIVYDDSMQLSVRDVDYAVATTSLPYIFDTDIETIPGVEGYLTPDKKMNYKTGDRDFVVGISWHTRSMDSGYLRSLKLADFAFLASYPNLRVINLQYGDTNEEREKAKSEGFDVYHDESVDSWADLQAFMDQVAACDLIISIDNTTVHAAGAMGVPCWTILPSDPFWRWPVAGDATPWYDGMRLFRPGPDAEYASVIADVKNALENLMQASDKKSALRTEPFKRHFPLPVEAERKVVLVNDTSCCFSWGNYATSHGLIDTLVADGASVKQVHTLELAWFSEQRINLEMFDDKKFLSLCQYRDPSLFKDLQTCDEVIINGEGLMNALSDAARQMMYLAYVAKTVYGRKVSLVNHSCFPEGGPNISNPKVLAYYLKVYKLLDACSVREPLSVRLLQSIGVPVQQSFDASVLWVRDFLEKHPASALSADRRVILSVGPCYESQYIEIFAEMCRILQEADMTPVVVLGAKWHVSQKDAQFSEDLKQLVPDLEIKKIDSADDFMKTLAAAHMVISGHYQTVIMSYAAGTPTLPVAGGSNYVALKAASEICDLPPPLAYEDSHIQKRVQAMVKTVSKQSDKDSDTACADLEKLVQLAQKNLTRA